MSTKGKSVREIVARLQEDDALFRLQLSYLKSGAATESSEDGANLMNVEEQAGILVARISQHLQTGRLTTTMVELLVAYLGTLNSEQQRGLLGLNQAHRRNSALGRKTNAISAYTNALSRGLSSKEALVQAYDAYFAAIPVAPGDQPDTYDHDCQKKNSSQSRYRNVGDKRMATLIKPCLIDAKLLRKGQVGRPTKSTIN